MLSRLRTFLAEMRDLEKGESSTFQLFLREGSGIPIFTLLCEFICRTCGREAYRILSLERSSQSAVHCLFKAI